MSGLTERDYEGLTPVAIKALADHNARLQAQTLRDYRVIEVLIAGGFLTREKYEEARALMENLP